MHPRQAGAQRSSPNEFDGLTKGLFKLSPLSAAENIMAVFPLSLHLYIITQKDNDFNVDIATGSHRSAEGILISSIQSSSGRGLSGVSSAQSPPSAACSRLPLVTTHSA
jgi:hypothetical protein